MTYTIPNSASAAFGPQAELDSGDFQLITLPASGTGVLSGCAVSAQGTPNMSVAVAGGVIAVSNGGIVVTSGNVTITTADASNPRIDLIAASSSGALSAVAGTPATHPVYPALPANSVILAAIYVPANATAINANQVLDRRVLLAGLDSTIFDVRNYGAVGDGATDNTTAIQNAINAAHANGANAAPAAPTGTSNTGTGSAFALNDSVRVQWAWYNGRGDSALSPTTVFTIAAAGNNIVLTLPASYPSGVLGLNIYMSAVSGGTTKYRIWSSVYDQCTTIAYAPGATYTISAYPGIADNGANGNTVPGVEAPPYATDGAGEVYIPGGIFLTQTLTLYPNVHLVGDGEGVTLLRLKGNASAPANYDLINGGANNAAMVNVYQAIAAPYNKYGHFANWSIRNLTLDGNRDNITLGSGGSSYCLNVYAFNYVLENVMISNGESGGVLSDYNGDDAMLPDAMECRWQNVKVHSCNGIGVIWAGPHDSTWNQVIIYNTQYHCLYVGPHANGLQTTTLHTWHPGTANGYVDVLCEAADCYFYDTELEGSNTGQLVLLANGALVYGRLYGSTQNAPNSSLTQNNAFGIQLGQAVSDTAYYYQNPANLVGGVSTGASNGIGIQDTVIDVQTENLFSSKGIFVLGKESNANSIRCLAEEYYDSSKYVAGTGGWFGGVTPYAYDHIDVACASSGFKDPSIHFIPGISASSMSGSAQTMTTGSTGGTISSVGTSIRRLQVSGAGDATGCLMPAGLYNGQEITLINENGSYNIAFATSATSKIANYNNAVTTVYKTGAVKLIWNSAVSLWFHVQ